MSRWFQCMTCGKLFDPCDVSAFIHPNLFGGVDKLCGDCKRREDRNYSRRMADNGITGGVGYNPKFRKMGVKADGAV